MSAHTATVISNLIKKDIELQRMQHAIDWYNGYCEFRERAARHGGNISASHLLQPEAIDPTVLAQVEKEIFSPDSRYREYDPPGSLKPRLSLDDQGNPYYTDLNDLEARLRSIEREIEACKSKPALKIMMQLLNRVLDRTYS